MGREGKEGKGVKEAKERRSQSRDPKLLMSNSCTGMGEKGGSGSQSTVQDSTVRGFELVDTNKDDALSRAEFAAAYGEGAPVWYSTIHDQSWVSFQQQRDCGNQLHIREHRHFHTLVHDPCDWVQEWLG